MSETLTIYHNPRCSKSRQTLGLIEERGVQPDIVRYLDTPPTATELIEIIRRLGISARDLLRTKETAYTELGLENPLLSEKDLIEAMVAYPILIERPIVVRGNQAVIGRPPENVIALLG